MGDLIFNGGLFFYRDSCSRRYDSCSGKFGIWGGNQQLVPSSNKPICS